MLKLPDNSVIKSLKTKKYKAKQYIFKVNLYNGTFLLLIKEHFQVVNFSRVCANCEAGFP